MPEILLPSSTSISSSSSTASSLLLYNHPQLSHRKSLPLRRISGWQWLSRRISRQGLNATHDNVHNHTHPDSRTHYVHDYNEKIIPSPQHCKTLASDTTHDYEAEQAHRAEHDIAESYAAYCRAFTSAGLHQHQHQHQHQQKRKTWMMDGLVEHTPLEDVDVDSNSNEMHTVHGAGNDEDEGDGDACVGEKRETCEAVPSPSPVSVPSPELEQPVLPPPQILTPSLYAEMRRAACDKERARLRLRQRRLWSWSWSRFPHIRQRES